MIRKWVEWYLIFFLQSLNEHCFFWLGDVFIWGCKYHWLFSSLSGFSLWVALIEYSELIWYTYVTHDIWTQIHNYNCEKFRRNVYLVFRAAFSCWSCFLILLYCSAGCHFIPIHQDSQVQLLKQNTCTIHENLIDLSLICTSTLYFSVAYTCIKWDAHVMDCTYENLQLNHYVLHTPLVSG